MLFGAIIIFLFSSDSTTKFMLDKISKTYDIQYDKFEGNILRDITIYNPAYKGNVLASKAHLDINFKALLNKDIKVDDIRLEDVDLKVLEKIINENSKKKKKKNLKSIPPISITSLFFTTKPYSGHGLKLKNLKLIANEVEGDLKHLSIGSFSFYTESDHTNITTNGSLQDAILNLDHLWITDIEIKKVIDFYKNNLAKADSNSSKKQNSDNSLKFVKEVNIKSFKTDINRYEYKKYKIEKCIIEAQDLKTDFHSINSKINISADTNMWNLRSDGYLKDDRLITDIDVKLIDKYFKRFIPFFDFNQIKNLTGKLDLNKDGIVADINLKTTNLLTKKVKNLKLDIQDAKAHVNFDFNPLKLETIINGKLNSNYAKNISLKSNLHYTKEDKFRYDGELFFKKLQKTDANLTKLFENSKINFYGNGNNIQAKLENKNLITEYNSTIYTKGLLNIKTKEIDISQFIKLPPKLKNLKANLTSSIPINFKDQQTVDADFKLTSNLLNIDGKLLYDDGFKIDSKLSYIPNSIIKNYDKNIKLKSLLPLNLKTTFIDSQLKSSFKNKNLSSDIEYNTKTKELKTTIKLNSNKLTLNGNSDKDIKLKANILSIQSLQKSLTPYYKFKTFPLDAEVNIDGVINQDSSSFDIKSRWLVYEYKPNKFAFAEKVKIKLNKKSDQYIIKNYYFSTFLDRDRVFQANNPSHFSLKNNNLKISSLSINDQAIASGNYDIEKSNGKFRINSSSYHYNDIEADIFLAIDVEADINKNRTKIDGKVNILKGTVKYKTKKEHYVTDEDIIIVQDEINKESLEEDSNLIIDVSIVSNQNIRYKVEDTDVKLKIDLKAWKDRSKKLELLGMVKLVEGYHVEATKKFNIQRGEILFAGEILNPFLNINVSYFTDPYDIKININGLLDSPIINFTSSPYLSQSDILSILLFDSTTDDMMSGSGDSSKAALSMFGNTFAKELVENFGIKLDKLVLSTTEDGKFGLEVGKKISKKMTIIYIDDVVQTIKVKYKHSRRFETDITLSPDTSGIDFIYKNEF